MPKLVAAGALVWRRPARSGAGGAVEVAVVHRPRYDDWSWPKGKPASGESLLATAVRETVEETGHDVTLGLRLGSMRYPVPAGEKVAHYWAARAGTRRFTPREEVDEVRWLPPAEAAALLSYPHDRVLLSGLDTAAATTGTVLLVRHAKAGNRQAWDGDDDVRPLTAAGKRQAEALRRLLPLFGSTRVYTAPLTRCRQTVEGLAADLRVLVEEEPLLAEWTYPDDPAAALAWLCEIAAGGTPAVMCSQGEVIPDLISRLAAEDGLALPVSPPPSRKGSFWVLSFGDRCPEQSPGAAPPVRLLAADYYDDPLS